MTRTEILLTMQAKEPRSLFYTMQLGGSMKQLRAMECEGLIKSCSRYGKGRQRDWYLTDEQHAALNFLLDAKNMLGSGSCAKHTTLN